MRPYDIICSLVFGEADKNSFTLVVSATGLEVGTAIAIPRTYICVLGERDKNSSDNVRLLIYTYIQTIFFTFEELKWHACHFILSKWQSFTDLNGALRAISTDEDFKWDAYGVRLETYRS